MGTPVDFWPCVIEWQC